MLFFAAFLALLWIVALIFLAEFTANPVTLNQDQIRRSPVIVSVEILDLEKSRVSVQKVWRGTELSGEIVVENLKETAVSPQQRFILPLSAVAGDKRRFRVTGSLVPSSAAEPEKMKLLVYPENEESIRQLQEILAREAEHPDP